MWSGAKCGRGRRASGDPQSVPCCCPSSSAVCRLGRVVTQPQLLREIWGPTHDEDTHYLRILVGKLRQKLGDDAAAPRWIATEPGVGLRFIGAAKP